MVGFDLFQSWADIDPDVYYKDGEPFGLIGRVSSDDGFDYVAACTPHPDVDFTVEMLVACRRLIRDENVCFITDDTGSIDKMKKVFGRYNMRFVVESGVLFSFNDKG